jgi:peptidoglycan/xylan/chitin deacetylase (PgdA/CDA1 family)
VTDKPVVPILLYHAVDVSPPEWIAPFTVRPDVFRSHLDTIVGLGLHPLTVSSLIDRLFAERPLPERPVVITFDDGFADMVEVVAPALAARALPATVYLTTGALRDDGPNDRHCLPPAHMLSWDQLGTLERFGIEIGAHTETHRPLDLLPAAEAGREIATSKSRLESALAHPVRTFAYPHGYYDRRVCALVQRAGFDSACAVKNALSSARDEQFALARLTVMATTQTSQISQWLTGQCAPLSSPRRRVRTRAWKQYRRLTQHGATR